MPGLKPWQVDSQCAVKMDGGLASRSSVNSKTLLRRLQRKHSETSYRRMKDKLLPVLKPMPIAAFSANLEEFRQSLFANKSEDVKTTRVESTVGGSFAQSPCSNRCSWCGIWMPLPNHPITIMETTTDVKEACSTSDPDPLVRQLEEVDKAVDALLEVSLCQAPCALVHANTNNEDEDVGSVCDHITSNSNWDHAGIDSFSAAEVHRSRRLSGDTLGMKKYCFKRTRARTQAPEAAPNSVSAISSLSPAPHHKYTTDESTGECKTQ